MKEKIERRKKGNDKKEEWEREREKRESEKKDTNKKDNFSPILIIKAIICFPNERKYVMREQEEEVIYCVLISTSSRDQHAAEKCCHGVDWQ